MNEEGERVDVFPDPDGEVTEIIPVVAPAGTVKEILFTSITVIADVTGIELTVIELTELKFVPVRYTVVFPAHPVEGIKLVIVGGAQAITGVAVEFTAEAAVQPWLSV